MLIRCTIALTCFLMAQGTSAQITVSFLEKNFEALVGTTEIKCMRFADFSEETDVRVGTTPGVGDLLFSTVDDVVLGIRYQPDDPGMIFSGRFRVVVASTKNQEVALNLLNGNVDVQSDTATAIASGETQMTSKHGQ